MKKLEELGISPAPWKIGQYFRDGKRRRNVKSLRGVQDHVADVPSESDAHLIAAAPDLYDALQQIMQCWGASVFDEGGIGCDTPLYCKHAGCRPETCHVFLKAKSALAKATGEEVADGK